MAQESYLQWKSSALANLRPSVDVAQQTDGAGGSHAVIRMRTAAVPVLRQFRSMSPVDMLSNLTDLGVAVWLMDDGNIKLTGRNEGGTQRPFIRLYCCGFGAEFAYSAAEWFRGRYGIEATVARPQKNPYLRIGVEGTAKLMERMTPWLRYDAAANNKQWVALPVRQGSAAGMVFVPASRVDVRTGGEPEGRYDIEVEGTHTFIYNNVVVSNCAEALALRKAFPEDLGGLYTAPMRWGRPTMMPRTGLNRRPIRMGMLPGSTIRAEVVGPTDQEWLDDALEQAATFATEDAGRKLWREAAAKKKAGQCSTADAGRIGDLITARIEDLQRPAEEVIPSAVIPPAIRAGDGRCRVERPDRHHPPTLRTPRLRGPRPGGTACFHRQARRDRPTRNQF